MTAVAPGRVALVIDEIVTGQTQHDRRYRKQRQDQADDAERHPQAAKLPHRFEVARQPRLQCLHALRSLQEVEVESRATLGCRVPNLKRPVADLLRPAPPGWRHAASHLPGLRRDALSSGVMRPRPAAGERKLRDATQAVDGAQTLRVA